MSRHWMAASMLLIAPLAWAEPDPEPGRGVARVSLLNGDISIQRGDSGDWVAAAINAPLVAGDKIAAGRASRAEVQFDHSNFLRLGEQTEVRMAELSHRRYQVQVSRGIVTFRVLRGSTAQVEINTPAVAVRPLEKGTYRIEVLESGQSEITVRDGEAEVYTARGSERLHEGRTMIARLGAADREVEVQVVRAEGRDEWDRWNERRDRQIAEARSFRYAPPGVWGVEELDAYGDWRYVGDYGWCWFPRLVYVGWSPYSWGRWVWVDWYGWTWVGYEPWGWAPYHWGRWFYRAGWGWGWYPGAWYARHYWCPAVVGFFGWGSRHGFSFGFGFGYSHIGWVPLAPGDPFYPWWGHGYYGRGNRIYIDNSVRITNVTNIRNVYTNAGVNGGIVTVHTEDFARGRVLNPRRVSVAEVGNAGQIRGLIPVTPEPESLRVSDREARVIARTGGRERFFERQQPASIERVPFQEQRAAIERSVRAAFPPEARRDRSAEPAGPAAGQATVRGAAAGPATAGERTAGRPGGVVEPAERGWRRFGEERRPGGVSALTAPAEGSPPAGGAERSADERGPVWRRLGAERRTGAEAAAPPAESSRSVEAGPRGWRRVGEGRQGPDAPAVQQEGVNGAIGSRGSGWRRIGESRPGASDTAPATSMERPRLDPDNGFRRREREDREMRMQRFPEPPRPALEPRSERSFPREGAERGVRAMPDIFRRDETPRMREEHWGGGQRQIQLNRPIIVPRARGGEGSGRTGSNAPAAPSVRGGGEGSGRSADHGGGGRGRR